MTISDNRLFDVTPYGGAEPTKTESKSHPRPHAELPVEDWVEPWVLIRNRQGVAPFFHLEQARNRHGAITTVCNLIGTRISNDGDLRRMVRCPSCDLGAQLK